MNVYKGKSDVLACGSYMGKTFMEQFWKVSLKVKRGKLLKLTTCNLDVWQG